MPERRAAGHATTAHQRLKPHTAFFHRHQAATPSLSEPVWFAPIRPILPLSHPLSSSFGTARAVFSSRAEKNFT